MRATMRVAASANRFSSADGNSSIRSLLTVSTCPGALATNLAYPAPVKIALVNRPSVGSGSRRTRFRHSNRLTR